MYYNEWFYFSSDRDLSGMKFSHRPVTFTFAIIMITLDIDCSLAEITSSNLGVSHIILNGSRNKHDAQGHDDNTNYWEF